MSSASRNGQLAICEVDGCHNRIHGAGRCRIHYDQARYAESIGESPEALAAAAREQAVIADLESGTSKVLATDAERLEAWEARRGALMERCGPPYVGLRPEAWWRYEVGRDQYLTGIGSASHDLGAAVRQRHEAEVEKVGWMAANDHLTDYEIDKIATRGREALERLDTDAERRAAGNADYGGDKLAVALADAVRGG